MASLVYDCFPRAVVANHASLVRDPVRIMLVGPGYVPDPAHEMSAVHDECEGAGYDPGGMTLLSKRQDGDGTFFADPVFWPGAEVQARGAVLYFGIDDTLICYVDFGRVRIADGFGFEIVWSKQGILKG